MKRVLIFSSLGLVGLGAGSAAVWQQVDRNLRPNSQIGDLSVGNLKRAEAAKKLHEWAVTRLQEPVQITRKGKVVAKVTPVSLGYTLDEAATLQQIPDEGAVTQAIGGGGEASSTVYTPVWVKTGTADFKPVTAALEKTFGPVTPARVRFVGGVIQRIPEAPRYTLDTSKLSEMAGIALKEGKSTIEAPLVEKPKRITDAMLAEITDTVSEFSTRFSSGNVPRASNIRLAASRIDGTLLLPGEVFSYNDTVGRRTLKAGFRVAGVYINGRHDTGVGGGICQVSTTLYNAALFANLPIVARQNHSLPVPYVPVGRDATVDYGNIDLKLRNPYETPIVITSRYTPGKLTFRILGKKVPGQSVAIVSSGVRYRELRTDRVVDRSLPPGATRVIEKGSPGRTCSTVRIVKRDGQLRRESLGTSYYTGSSRIIARNPDPPRPKPVSPPEPTPALLP